MKHLHTGLNRNRNGEKNLFLVQFFFFLELFPFFLEQHVLLYSYLFELLNNSF